MRNHVIASAVALLLITTAFAVRADGSGQNDAGTGGDAPAYSSSPLPRLGAGDYMGTLDPAHNDTADSYVAGTVYRGTWGCWPNNVTVTVATSGLVVRTPGWSGARFETPVTFTLNGCGSFEVDAGSNATVDYSFSIVTDPLHLPDFAVTSVWVQQVGAQPTTQLLVHVNVSNVGDASGAAFAAAALIASEPHGVTDVVASRYAAEAPLAPGDSRSYEFSLNTTGDVGNFTVWGQVGSWSSEDFNGSNDAQSVPVTLLAALPAGAAVPTSETTDLAASEACLLLHCG